MGAFNNLRLLAGLLVTIDGRGDAADGALGALLAASGARTAFVGSDGSTVGAEGVADLAVVVSHYATTPRRAARWLSADVPHLLLEFGDRSVRVGPVVQPGSGPCAHCLELARTDRDAAWPALAAQLAGRRAPSADPLGVATAAAVATRMLGDVVSTAAAGRSEWARAALRIPRPGGPVAGGSFLTRESFSAHPRCGCRSLTGIVSPFEPLPGAPPARPTTATIAAGRG